MEHVVKSEREGISIEEIIEGTSFGGTYTYLEDGCIYKVSFNVVSPDELIEQQNGACGGFMDELSTIHVSEEGLAKVRAGASASEVLSEEEIEEINDLVHESLTLSYYYSGEKSLYEFEDADFEIENYVIPDGSHRNSS